jgi:hypothetical protein
LKPWLGFQRVEQPDVAGTVGELRAGDPVIDEDAAVIDVPALALGVSAGGSIWRATDFSSFAIPFCSVDLRA